jgi:hypothetical protein
MFTPAPWIVDDSIKKSKGYKDDVWQILCVNPDMQCPHTVAHIENYQEIRGQELFIENNAKLIAASPDLYKACMLAIHDIQLYLSGEWDTENGLGDTLEELQQTIKRINLCSL